MLPAGGVAAPRLELGAAAWLVFAGFFLSIGLSFSPALQSQFTLPKMFWLRVSAAAIAAVWCVRLQRGAVRVSPFILAATGALAAWWVITLPFAVHLPTALWGMPGRYNGFVNQLTLLLIFLAVASMGLSRRDVVRLLALFVIALVPLAIYDVAQGFGVDWFTWPNSRPGSTIGHPVPLAAILALGMPIVLSLALTAATRIAGAVWLAIAALLLLAIGTTLSRGPWIGAAIAVCVVLLPAGRRRALPRARQWIVVAAVALGVAATVAVGRVPGTRITQRIGLLAQPWTDPSFVNRFVFFEAAAAMIRDRPVFGSGFESFGLLYPRYRPVEGEAVPDDTVPSMVHNGYLQLAASTGLPGLAIYVTLVAGIMLLLWRARAEAFAAGGSRDDGIIAAGLAGAIAGFLIQDMSGWLEVSSSAFFWTIAGAAASFCTAGAASSWSLPRARRPVAMAMGAAVIVCCGGLAFDADRERRADRALFVAQRLNPATDWPAAAQQIHDALDLTPLDARYLDEAGVLHLKRLYARRDSRVYQDGAALLERARLRNPFDPYVLIHRVDLETAALHAGIIRTPSTPALDAVNAAVAMDPHNASVHESIARFELAALRPDAALRAIVTARTLRPAHAGYRIVEGDALRALGERSQSIDAYRSEAALHPTADADWTAAERKVIAELVESADYAAAVAEALVFLKRQPRDVTGHVLLGLAHLGRQDLEPAKSAFDAALRIDPDDISARQGRAEVDQRIQKLQR
jgi:O-antigen ligase